MRRWLEKLKKQSVPIALSMGVLVILLLHAREDEGGPLRWSAIDQMENLAYDARLLLTMPRTVDPGVVIIDIDEKSLQAEGRWPWGRDRVARMVEQLFEKYKVALVGFDVVFAEPDESSGLKVLEQLSRREFSGIAGFEQRLREIKPTLDNDGIFSGVIGKYKVVLGYFFNEVTSAKIEAVHSGVLPPPTFPKGAFEGKHIAFRPASGYGGNLAIFQDKAAAAGHFNPSLDSDGIVRRVPMVMDYDGAQYESLSLAMARVYLGAREVEAKFEQAPLGASRNYAGLESLRIGNRVIPVDEHIEALVPYRGGQGSFPYVSATDVIHGQANPELLQPGAIAIVGTTAAGLLDLRSTPVQKAYPGVEVHANLIAGILEGRIMQKPAYVQGAEIILLLVFGLVMALTLPFLGPLAEVLMTLGALTLYTAFNMLCWVKGQLVLPLASGLVLITLLFIIDMFYGYFVERRGKRQLTGLFGQYVPPELVDEMANDPERYSLEAVSREMTVLFSDVRGFTTISEGMNPKALSELMNEVLTPMTHVIHEHRGTIDKYMGDAIMAFWGAPVPDHDHARHALLAALRMIQKLDSVNAGFKQRGWPVIKVGIGINTGTMTVGNMGSEFRMAYTVMGDSVNLGSRLEGLTKTYGVDVIVSESTKAAVPELAYRELDMVRVKGKDKPVSIYEPLGSAADVSKILRDELDIYKQALKYYRTQQWDMAELQFLNLAKSSARPRLYQMYAERVAEFRRNPPGKDWDGVYTHTTK
ncbi:MAG TPA: adenylate/guanylate cyclase domain-containing protein [Gammaproteobacteria bacterium]|nr:adenylate/guanylate cyclase domain-containing protein [Gammaproteobacteria bacterium]